MVAEKFDKQLLRQAIELTTSYKNLRDSLFCGNCYQHAQKNNNILKLLTEQTIKLVVSLSSV